MNYDIDFKIDLHTHTLASGHAYNTIDEMAAEAKRRGMTYLGITEHAPKMPGTCHEFYFQNLHVVERERDDLRLLLGAEVNIYDYEGSIDLSTYALERLDVVIASLHMPCIKPGNMAENTSAYIGALNNPYVDIIGHPDDGRFAVDYEALVNETGRLGKLIEINNNSLRPTGPRKGAYGNDLTILRLCKKKGVSVILGSDAHTRTDIGNFSAIYPVLLEADFPLELIANRSAEELNRHLHKKIM